MVALLTRGRSATLEYHEYVTALLWKLSARQHGGRWRVYANRFSKYRRIPPVLRRGDRAPEVLPVLDGYRDYAPITFWLSKPSTVTFRIAGTRTSQWFERGWQTFQWWPYDVPAGRYPVWATATDRGGNSMLLGLPWVRVGEDSNPPSVRVALDVDQLSWRASDAKSPWFEVRLERMVEEAAEARSRPVRAPRRRPPGRRRAGWARRPSSSPTAPGTSRGSRSARSLARLAPAGAA